MLQKQYYYVHSPTVHPNTYKAVVYLIGTKKKIYKVARNWAPKVHVDILELFTQNEARNTLVKLSIFTCLYVQNRSKNSHTVPFIGTLLL